MSSPSPRGSHHRRSTRAVLAVDDRDDRLENLDGKAWKEWLRLSNWLGISDRHRVTTRTLPAAAPETIAVGSDQAALSFEWQTLLDDAVSDAERELIRALAEAGAAAPVLGYETADGEVLDLAWMNARVAVKFDEDAKADGWTICPPDPAQIVEALKLNGVA